MPFACARRVHGCNTKKVPDISTADAPRILSRTSRERQWMWKCSGKKGTMEKVPSSTTWMLQTARTASVDSISREASATIAISKYLKAFLASSMAALCWMMHYASFGWVSRCLGGSGSRSSLE